MNNSLYDRQGFVYVLQNPEFPHLLKIGATRAHPLRRAKELSAGSSSPQPFEIVYYRDFSDCFEAETIAHAELSDCRSNDSREFFKTSIDQAVRVIDSIRLESNHVTGGSVKTWRAPMASTIQTPFAELFASFKESDDPYLNLEERAQCRKLEKSIRK